MKYFFVQHSRHRKTTSHPRQRSILLNKTEQKEKSRIQTYEILKHFAKNGQKTFKTAFMKQFLSFSKT